MLGGSLLIAVLAIAVDLVLVLFQRLFLSAGPPANPTAATRPRHISQTPRPRRLLFQGGTS